MKNSDAFDLEGFLSHCEGALKRIPASEDNFQDLATVIRAADQAKRDAMSPWEKLGIEWEDYHPQARDILDEPFYWDCCYDFSPNGNDTGADVLEAYRDWLKTHRNGKPLRFLEALAKQWGYSGLSGMDGQVLDEAAVGLAFADIKLRGECDREANWLAMTSVDRQRIQAEGASDWAYRDERLWALETIKSKLHQMEIKRLESKDGAGRSANDLL